MGNRALLVGINAYPDPAASLAGCVNDVQDMATFIEQNCGFATDDIRLLADARATKEAIVERLGWLLAGVETNDRLLFHYSGHGTLFPVRNTQGSVAVVYDAICPVDFDWTPEHAITSADLREIFSTIPGGVEFVFVSDSCHSGDLTKGMRRYKPRFLAAPTDIGWRIRAARSKGLAAVPLAHDNCALIAGCKSNQESADASFNGRANGALTYYLLQSLKVAGELSTPLTDVIQKVCKALLENNYPDQTPQLRGPDNLLVRGFLQS